MIVYETAIQNVQSTLKHLQEALRPSIMDTYPPHGKLLKAWKIKYDDIQK